MSQARKQINIDKFKAWSDLSTHSLDYYLPFLNLKSQKLKRETVRKACGFGDKVLKGDNDECVILYEAFQNEIVLKLREAGLLPHPIETNTDKTTNNKSDKKSSPASFDQEKRNNKYNAARVAELEKEVLDLKSEIKRLEIALESSERVLERNRETFAAINEFDEVQ